MAMQYTRHDQDLIVNGLVINIVAGIEEQADLGKNTCNPAQNRKIINRKKKIDKSARVGETIKFQFPPKIVDDSQTGSWNQNRNALTADMIAVYEGADPRQTTVEWTYIVTNTQCEPDVIQRRRPRDEINRSSGWTPQLIHRQLRLLRGYWRNSFIEGKFQSNMIVFMQLWALGGQRVMSFRLAGLSIKHSTTIVNKGIEAFPLRTDISAQFKMWPDFSSLKGAGKAKQQPAVPVPAVPGQPPPAPAAAPANSFIAGQQPLGENAESDWF